MEHFEIRDLWLNSWKQKRTLARENSLSGSQNNEAQLSHEYLTDLHV